MFMKDKYCSLKLCSKVFRYQGTHYECGTGNLFGRKIKFVMLCSRKLTLCTLTFMKVIQQFFLYSV